MTDQSAARRDSTGFAYFMLRVPRPEPERPAGISGTIERLGTGEKRSFAGGAELVVLLESWPGNSPKMRAGPWDGNVAGPDSGG